MTTTLITPPDLIECEREPIHIPGSIQSHGFLLAAPGIDETLTHVSENAHTIAGTGAASLRKTWTQVLGPAIERLLRLTIADTSLVTHPVSLAASWSPDEETPPVELIVHVRAGFIIVEGEQALTEPEPRADTLRHELAPFLARLNETKTTPELCALAAHEARRLTRFDRVLVYQFDEEWNGTVIAESRNEALPSILHHRFPASDIPRQARELYHINRLRLIATNAPEPVRLLAATADLPPLDLTLSTLRGISPVHLEYMRNMGTGSSMSASIMREGKLWGLLSCHGREPRRLSFSARSECDLLGQILSMQLATREQSRQLAMQIELRKILGQLLTRMTEAGDFVTAIDAGRILELTGATGAAITRGPEVIEYGKTPPPETILKLRDWLVPHCGEGIFSTASLPVLYPEIGDSSGLAGGLLAISISPQDQTYVLWFRAELVETVMWGGDPHQKSAPAPEGARIHPRKSFDTWKETVRLRSAPWLPAEVDSALGFRRAVIDIVLKQAAAKAHLLTEVQRVNKELEAFAYTVSHDLRAPFRHVRGYAELLQMEKRDQLDEDGRYLLTKILNSTAYAGELVDTLLAFSRMNLTPLSTQLVALSEIVERAQAHATAQAGNRSIEWRIAPLPLVNADPDLLRLAIQNLLENAVKYTSKRNHALIEVSVEETNYEWVISVKDNGAGFDSKYADKLFGVFQRLHTTDQFAGIGIGLATVRRIVERHGGRIWAEGALDIGAHFHFSLPHFPQQLPPSHAQTNPSR